uniref:Si:ch73-233k15.2 n=1 Tax=Gouania willdenowi TaxID=441366 RepID=A0A8C5NEZ7_GOUWI
RVFHLFSKLQNALCSYTTDTLSYILTVKSFCENSSKWMLWRETELNLMMGIKDRTDQITKVTDAKNKGQVFLKHMKNMFTPAASIVNQYAKLEKELTDVLRDTLDGLNKLDCFVDAVEKLAVTSPHVFMENEMLCLPEDITLDDLQVVLLATAFISPLLLEFKNDNEEFFLPKLKNMEFLTCRLDKYIQTTKILCEKLEKSCSCHFSLKKTNNIKVNVHKGLSKDDIQKMLDHINLLDEIRWDQDFRMVFLFQPETGQDFVKEFTERQPRMLEFLQQLEETAVQLSRMHTGAKISSVAGSSVGLVGGVMSIVGLALIPVTFGASLALTMTGVGLGIASGVNSAVTIATEIGVNKTQNKKAGEFFQNFMEDVQSLQDCVDQVSNQIVERLNVAQLEDAVGREKVACTGRTVAKSIDLAAGVRLLKTKEVVSSVGKAVAQEGKLGQSISRMASDVPDIGQVAAKSSLALTKSARVGLFAVNALFVGLDIFIICKDSISLAKGSQSEAAQLISERVALWRSVMGSWQKIHKSLTKGLPAAEKKEAVLNTPFYMSACKKLTKILKLLLLLINSQLFYIFENKIFMSAECTASL